MEMKNFNTKTAEMYIKKVLDNIDEMSCEEAKKELKLIGNFCAKIMETTPVNTMTAVFSDSETA